MSKEVLHKQFLVCFCFTRRKNQMSNIWAQVDTSISTVSGADTGDFCMREHMPFPSSFSINQNTYVHAHAYSTATKHLWRVETSLNQFKISHINYILHYMNVNSKKNIAFRLLKQRGNFPSSRLLFYHRTWFYSFSSNQCQKASQGLQQKLFIFFFHLEFLP